MCSLACWSLIALKPAALFAYVEVDGKQVGGIGGTMDVHLHQRRKECIQCCDTEVRLLHSNSSMSEQLVKKFIDLHQFHNLRIPAKVLWLLPNVPYPESG